MNLSCYQLFSWLELDELRIHLIDGDLNNLPILVDRENVDARLGPLLIGQFLVVHLLDPHGFDFLVLVHSFESVLMLLQLSPEKIPLFLGLVNLKQD